VLLVSSAIINLVLTQRTLSFYRKIHQLNGTIQQLSLESQAKPGSWVPPIEVMDQDGHKVSILYSEEASPTILYLFSPECDWCTRNLESVKALEKQTARQYRFIGLSLSGRNLIQ
jgi:hypothetical protein